MGQSDRFDRILEKENRPPTRQNWVLEKQTRRRPPEKSDRSAADRVRSAGVGGLGWPGLWTTLTMVTSAFNETQSAIHEFLKELVNYFYII